MHIFLIAAISVDGFIAEKTDQTSIDWTSKEDKQFFRERTKQAGVVVMGSSTYKTIGRPLPGRVNIVYSSKELACDSTQLKAGEVGYTTLPPQQLLQELEKAGHKEVAICGGASVYTQFLKAGVIETLYLTVEPVIFSKGVKLINEDLQIRLQLKKVEMIGESTTLFEYSVKK